jgi:hypothetical protein
VAVTTSGLDKAKALENAMSAKPLPSLDLLRKNFAYDPDTGHIKGASRRKPPVPNTQGYVCFKFMGQYLASHRIAWALHYGYLPPPEMEIDHINGIRNDNRIANLRLVSLAQNMKNKAQYRNNTHGYPGIMFESASRRVNQWRAQIQVNGRAIKLGSYKCKTAAIFARKRAEITYGFDQRAGDQKWQLCMR